MTLEEFLYAAEILAEKRTTEVLQAEERCRLKNAAPLEPRTYPNTNYWDRVGPMLETYRYIQRSDSLERELDAEIEAITMKYQALLSELETQICE